MEPPLNPPPPETPPAPPSPAPGPRRRSLLIGGIAGGALLVCLCCAAATAGVLFLDPFGWKLLDRLAGRYDPLAEAAPGDSAFYLSADLLQFRSARLQRVLQAFADVPGAGDVQSADDAVQELDKSLGDSLGLSVTDDILPWLGQRVGVTAADLSVSQFGPSEGDIVVLAEVRDRRRAEAFLFKFIDAVAAESGTTFDDEIYKGVTLYIQNSADEPVVVALSRDVFLLSNRLSALKAVIDTQQGAADSLADRADFRDLRAGLPGDRLLDVYFPGQGLLNLAENSQTGLPMDETTRQTVEALGGLYLTLAATDEGLRLDASFRYDEAKLSDAQREMMSFSARAAASDLLPAGTLAYALGHRPDLTWATYRDTLNQAGGDFDEALRQFERQFGFDADEVMHHLNGEVALALLADPDSLLVENAQMELGFVVMAQTDDAALVQAALDDLNGALETDMGMTVEAQTLAGADVFALTAPGSGGTLVYGVAQNWLTLASSAAAFTDVFDGGEAVSEAAVHRQVWSALPDGVRPVLYVDMRGVLALVRDGLPSAESFDREVGPYLEPIKAIAAGATPYRNGAAQSTIVIFIENP